MERVCSRARLRDAALLALVTGLSLLGGYLPTSLVVLAVTALWSLAWMRAPRWPSAARVTVATMVGLAVAAGALWPMLLTLAGSPAAARSMRESTQPWQNLATFALPDFWGTPVARNWWYGADGNYPEFVSYLGVATLACAGAGVASSILRRDRRGWLAAGIAVVALMQMYGAPPVSWASVLPGLSQMNPYRWNVALAFGMAVLAALGVEAWQGDRSRASAGVGDGAASPTAAHVRWALVGALVMLGLIGIVAAAALADQLTTIKQLGMQAFEKRQIARFVTTAGIAAPCWRC